MAATQIQSGFHDCIIAGGVESISTSQGHTNMHMYANDKLAEEVPGIYHAMGTTAECVADRYNVPRESTRRVCVIKSAKACGSARRWVLR